MLNSLRSFATTWPGKILGMFLLIGLAGFGITGVLTSIGTNTVARVGDREITIRDFQAAYQTQINVAARQLGTVPTPDQAISLGIPSQVLNQLATDEALNILSNDFSLGVSNERLAEGLRSVSGFSGTLGTFDREVFERVLQQNNITEKEYFDTRREAAMRSQIVQALFSQAKTPDALSKIVQRYGEDTRTLEYFLVSESSLLPIGDPGDEVLAPYLFGRKELYRTEEMRKIRAIQLSPESLAKNIEISDAEITAEYERIKQSLFSPEKRAISQIVFPSDEIAAQFQAAIDDGQEFAEIATALNLEVSNLGLSAARDILDPQLAEAAFGADQNTSLMIAGLLGQRAITVTAIEPASQLSLDEVRDDLELRLALGQAREQFVDILDQIEEQRAAFIDLEKTSEEFNLPLVEISLNQRGDELADALTLEPAEAGRIANAIFNSDVGGLAAMVPLGANKSVWFDLISIEAERDQSLEEVRDAVASAWIAEERTAALETKVSSLVELLNEGQSVSDVAVFNGFFPIFSQPMTRSGDGSAAIDANVAASAFFGGADHVGAAQNGNGDYVVFQVTSVEPAQEPLSEQDLAVVDGAYKDNIYSDFATALRDDAQLSINQGVLNQILSFGTTGANQSGGGFN